VEAVVSEGCATASSEEGSLTGRAFASSARVGTLISSSLSLVGFRKYISFLSSLRLEGICFLKLSVSFGEGNVFFEGSAALRKTLSVALRNWSASGCGIGAAAAGSAGEGEIWTSTAAADRGRICALGEGTAVWGVETAASSSFSNLLVFQHERGV